MTDGNLEWRIRLVAEIDEGLAEIQKQCGLLGSLSHKRLHDRVTINGQEDTVSLFIGQAIHTIENAQQRIERREKQLGFLYWQEHSTKETP